MPKTAQPPKWICTWSLLDVADRRVEADQPASPGVSCSGSAASYYTRRRRIHCCQSGERVASLRDETRENSSTDQRG